MKRLSIALVVSAAVMALSAGVASAHKVHYDSTVTINFTGSPYGDTFSGTVSSNKAACEKNRTVKIKREAGDTDPVFGTDTTDNDGDYTVTNGLATPGSYYAKVKKLFLEKNKNHKHICDSAKSALITVP